MYYTAWWPQWIMCVLRAQSYPTLCDSMEYSPPDRLPCSWNFPGKNIGVGCHFLPGDLPNPDVNLHTAWWPQWIMCVLRARSCPTLCDSMEHSPPDRLLCSWNFPGKNTGVGCHFPLSQSVWCLPNKVETFQCFLHYSEVIWSLVIPQEATWNHGGLGDMEPSG